MDKVTWTDDKIGALAAEVHDGFARAEVEYARTDERLKAIDQHLRELKTGQTQMESRFDGLQRTLLQVGGGLIGTLVAGIVTLIALLLTH